MRTLGVILTATVLLVGGAQGQTYVSGYISMSSSWGAWGSPYIVQGDVTVINGVTLTIHPGTTVAFDGGYVLSTAYGGVIVADGQPGDRILFTSNAASPAAGDWNFVQIFGGGAASFQHCVFEYAWDGMRANDSVVTLTSCVFRHCQRGIQCLNAAPTITDCRITNNFNGIVINGPAYPFIDSCDIFGNQNWNVSVASISAPGTIISAENCWWGSANETVIADSILDAADYPEINGTVDYEPWQGALPATSMSWGEVKDAYGAQSGR